MSSLNGYEISENKKKRALNEFSHQSIFKINNNVRTISKTKEMSMNNTYIDSSIIKVSHTIIIRIP